eukprot:8235960-Pyramimonas_sp.AAC.1
MAVASAPAPKAYRQNRGLMRRFSACGRTRAGRFSLVSVLLLVTLVVRAWLRKMTNNQPEACPAEWFTQVRKTFAVGALRYLYQRTDCIKKRPGWVDCSQYRKMRSAANPFVHCRFSSPFGTQREHTNINAAVWNSTSRRRRESRQMREGVEPRFNILLLGEITLLHKTGASHATHLLRRLETLGLDYKIYGILAQSFCFKNVREEEVVTDPYYLEAKRENTLVIALSFGRLCSVSSVTSKGLRTQGFRPSWPNPKV